MSAPLRLVFLGSDALALPTLDAIADGPASPATVVGVYTQPDRPHGRGQRVEPGPIKQWAERRGLPVFQPERLGSDDAAGVRDRLRADVALVTAYGLLLKDEMLAAPRLGTFNVHTSILPRLRGASPIATAVASGVGETGVSFMRLVRKLDAGPVADCERVPVGPRDTAADVTAKLSSAAVPLVIRGLRELAAGTLALREQDETAATYCRRLLKADGVLDFARPARELAARVNGLFPWPGCSVAIGDMAVKLGLADAEGEGAASAPGAVLGCDGDAVRIATGSGVLRLLRLQRPGGRMLPARDFLRGFALPEGTLLPSTPMTPLESSLPFPRA
ncbi:MAG TPA: methionyl-tRNA formyltransferase [Opitutaceae bacterium]